MRHRLLVRAFTLGAAALLAPALVLIGASSGARAVEWYDLGWSTSDDGGAYRFETTTGDDLIGMGLTVMRVTSGECAAENANYIFETVLVATSAGNGEWGGALQPVSAAARALPALDPYGGDVHVVPVEGGTSVTIAIDTVVPGMTLEVCLHAP